MRDPFRKAYTECRFNAAARGHAWLLTLEQFTAIWKRSRRWPMRGRGRGKYVLARKGDRGAYRVGNVKVILFENNGAEKFKNMTPAQQAQSRLESAKGGYKNKGRARPDLAARNKGEQQKQAIRDNWKTRAPRTGWTHSEATKAKMKVSAALSWQRGDRKIRVNPT